MQSFQIPSSGAALNAIEYVAAGAGSHPTVIVLHGFPGNEKNLDLAQSIRRAGWNAVYFDYRGSWGSPGSFTFAHCMEDTQAAIAYLREPANAAKLRIDPKRIALVGHSMGGFLAAFAGSHDSGIIGTALISAADMAGLSKSAEVHGDPAATVAKLGKRLEEEDILPLAGCTGESLAKELLAHQTDWEIVGWANLFADRPLLVISSDDGLAPSTDMLIQAVRKQGSTHVADQHFATDHSYSDQRIALQIAVLNWLETLK